MGEIEAYIIKKLDHAIKEASRHSNFHFAARVILPDLHKEFTEIKQRILEKQDKIKKESTVTPPPAAAAAAAVTSLSNAPTTAGVDGGADEPETSTPATTKVTEGGATEHESVTAATTLSDAPTTAGVDGGADEPKTSTPATTKVTEGGATEYESVTAATTLSDAPTTAGVNVGADEPKTSTPATAKVTEGGATEYESVTATTSDGGGKKELEPEALPAAKTSATDAKSDSSIAPVKPVNEENLLREQLYYLNNVLTEWQMITEKPFSYASVKAVKDLSKTLKKIKQDLKTDSAKKSDESNHSSIATTGVNDNDNANANTSEQVVEFRWSTRLVDPKRVHGFEDKILSLERLLVHHRKHTDPFKAFGIHGMAGVGKTTLCQSIFNRNEVMEYFLPRIWVCLSTQKGEDEDNRKEVVKRMLRCLGIDDKIINMVNDKQDIRGLLFALRLQLTGKRYFIVLDDAYDTDNWFDMLDLSTDADNANDEIYDKFAYGLPKDCGGKVLVTSRAKQVVKNMVGDEENLRCMEPFTDKESCWEIFKDTVEEDGTQFPEALTTLKSEIVKRCDGLPLAAKMLGQIKHKELRKNVGNGRGATQQPK